MRESRPYGSERGAFSNGRPYRDRTAMLLAMPLSNRGECARRLFEGALESEAFVIPESQRDAVAECVEKVVLSVAVKAWICWKYGAGMTLPSA